MVTTKPYRCDSPEEELEKAWEEEGRKHFNLCHQCGKWVCDAMYNADVLHCADCTPWENKPKYCSNCGTRVGITDTFCRKCGAKLFTPVHLMARISACLENFWTAITTERLTFYNGGAGNAVTSYL